MPHFLIGNKKLLFQDVLKKGCAADRIRDELKARHVVLEDTPQGIKWRIEE